MKSEQVVAALGAIAHEHRLAIYRMLVERGADGLPAGVVAERLDMPPSSLTFHLQQMRNAGLVTQRRVGRQIIYAADFGAMNALVTYLTDNCCGRGSDACCDVACAPAKPATTRARAHRRSA